MNLLAVTARGCTGIGRISVLSCLSLAFSACDGSPAQRSDAGEDASPALDDGGWSESGDAGSSDASPSGGVDGGDGGARTDGGGTGPAGVTDSGAVPDSGSVPRDAGMQTDSGHAGDGGAGAESCVNVSGAGDQPWFNLTVAGTAFDADEGKRMRVVVATQPGNRVGLADVPIVKGAFTVTLPEVLNAGWYVGVTLYVDRNDNDTCETDEHVWEWATRIIVDDMYFEVTPDELCDHSFMSCRRKQPTRATCWVSSGELKLTEPLPCIPDSLAKQRDATPPARQRAHRDPPHPPRR